MRPHRDYFCRMMSVEPTTTPGRDDSAGDSAAEGRSALHLRAKPGEPVIFFDGVCGLCNAWIDFVIRHDRRRTFRFGALQGVTARDWLDLASDATFDSVALADHTGIYWKSDAVWRILMQLGGGWRIGGYLLRLVPRPLRNWGYDFVARRRYRWFGKKETCRVPTPDERARFLP
jgi:predicted DCC family thiol-disulfide oxidoreductase YuxK